MGGLHKKTIEETENVDRVKKYLRNSIGFKILTTILSYWQGRGQIKVGREWVHSEIRTSKTVEDVVVKKDDFTQ